MQGNERNLQKPECCCWVTGSNKLEFWGGKFGREDAGCEGAWENLTERGSSTALFLFFSARASSASDINLSSAIEHHPNLLLTAATTAAYSSSSASSMISNWSLWMIGFPMKRRIPNGMNTWHDFKDASISFGDWSQLNSEHWSFSMVEKVIADLFTYSGKKQHVKAEHRILRQCPSEEYWILGSHRVGWIHLFCIMISLRGISQRYIGKNRKVCSRK